MKYQENAKIGILILSALSLLIHGLTAQSSVPSGQIIQQEATRYYSLWIGVQAPEFAEDIKARASDKSVHIKDFRGKRILIFSFDAGDFLNESKDSKYVEQLRAVQKIVAQNKDSLEVIGFTYGVDFFLPGVELPPNIKALTDFPIVNSHKIQLPEPYNLLQRWPSAILIDSKGIIIGISQQPVTDQMLVAEMEKKDWQGELQQAPTSIPPEIITNYSQRKPWIILTYRKQLESGTVFQREFGHRTEVFTKEEIPEDVVSTLREVDGKTLKVQVQDGDPIRKIHFDMK